MSVDLWFRPWTEPRAPKNYPTPGPPPPNRQRSTFFLLANLTWNDYQFTTDFVVHLFEEGAWRPLGVTCVGVVGQEERQPTYDLLGSPIELNVLPETCFALGQGLDFYNALLRRLGETDALAFLRATRDVVVDADARARAEGERVFTVSLQRSNGAVQALERAGPLFGRAGGVTRDAFRAVIQLDGTDAPHVFDFDFGRRDPFLSPIAVLVGLNGTGKTQSMAQLARLLSRVFESDSAQTQSASRPHGSVAPRPSIYGVVAISFSAFDDFVIPSAATSERFKYVYCGLRSLADAGRASRSEIVDTEVRVRFETLAPADRRNALTPLLPTLEDDLDVDRACATGDLPYHRLSAGQRIVLSVASELVRNVTDRVLVMMDEPEIHLHPQLLSSLMAWTYDLLIDRESFAIVATHSPIVVQQIPAAAVHILRRSGSHPSVRRPSIETFGANLTEIVREVFEDRTGDRSYQEVLGRLWREHGMDVDAVNALFDGRLGMNAQIFLRSLRAE